MLPRSTRSIKLNHSDLPKRKVKMLMHNQTYVKGKAKKVTERLAHHVKEKFVKQIRKMYIRY